MSATEKRNWNGNKVVDKRVEQSSILHFLPEGEGKRLSARHQWRQRLLLSIANFLAVLPNTAELYKDHLLPNEPECLWEEEQDEDVFGHSLHGLDDVDEPPRPSIEQQLGDGHEWNWIRGAWRCRQCLKALGAGSMWLLAKAAHPDLGKRGSKPAKQTQLACCC